MVYLEKNDLWDEVWLRYKESYDCTNDCDNFVPGRDIDYFCSFLRKNMREDLKQAKKDGIRIVKRLRREYRKARRKAWWERVKAKFKIQKKKPDDAKTEHPPLQEEPEKEQKSD